MLSTTEVQITGDCPPPPLTPVSFEEFLAWAPENVIVEWVDGEIIIMSPVSIDHARISAFLLKVMGLFVEERQLGEVIAAPFLMHLETRPSGREPDLLFVAQDHHEQLQRTYLDGPADLAVEVISPDSVVRDRGDKFIEYEASGVREYWIIDPMRREALFYQRGADGLYQSVPLDAEGIYRSAVVSGFWLRAEWLWQRPLPKITDILRQLGL